MRPQRLRVVPFWRTPGGAPMNLLPTLMVLSAMGLLVLLIACANIAGLVLVRGMSRRGEIAVRLALGRHGTRIVRLLIVENLVLALPGAILGVLLAQRGIPLLVGYAEKLSAPNRIFFNIGVDRLVLAFAALVACGSALVFGLVPALQSTQVDLVSVINADASPRGAARGRLRTGLVVAQVAVSLVLLVGAGLVTRSLEAARRANPGFDRDHVTALGVDLKQNGYDERSGRVFYRHLLDAARAIAAVESATLAAIQAAGVPRNAHAARGDQGYEPRRGEDLAFMSNIVAPDYFRRCGSISWPAVVRGRDDERGAVAIVNQTLAQRFWGGAANAIGKRIRVAEGDWRTVIGVAADVKYVRINEAPRPYVYLPFLQSYRSSMILPTRGSASATSWSTRRASHIAALDPEAADSSCRDVWRSRPGGALMLFQLMATMLFLFGVAGMALAAIGTYGLVSYIVKQSTHEIGIRMALGATGLSVVRGSSREA